METYNFHNDKYLNDSNFKKNDSDNVATTHSDKGLTKTVHYGSSERYVPSRSTEKATFNSQYYRTKESDKQTYYSAPYESSKNNRSRQHYDESRTKTRKTGTRPSTYALPDLAAERSYYTDPASDDSKLVMSAPPQFSKNPSSANKQTYSNMNYNQYQNPVPLQQNYGQYNQPYPNYFPPNPVADSTIPPKPRGCARMKKMCSS